MTKEEIKENKRRGLMITKERRILNIEGKLKNLLSNVNYIQKDWFIETYYFREDVVELLEEVEELLLEVKKHQEEARLKELRELMEKETNNE